MESASLVVQTIMYHPAAPSDGADDFWVTVQVLMGETVGGPADSFDLTVCSPGQLSRIFAASRWDEDDALPGGNIRPLTGVWIMRRWGEREFEEAVNRLASAFSPGPNFQEVAARVGRIIPWEYDYVHDRRVNAAAGLPDLSRSFWHD